MAGGLLVTVNERLAEIRVVVTAIHVADAGVGELEIRNDFSKLKQEPQGLTTMIASRIVRGLDQFR
jgi:hypothetical protein